MSKTFQVVQFNSLGDGITALYVNETLYSYGDEYHDRMDTWVDGFLAGVRFKSRKPTVIEYYEVRNEEDCEDELNGETPPMKLKDVKGMTKIDE